MMIAYLNDANELARYPGYVKSTEASEPVLHENHYYEKFGSYTEEIELELCARIKFAVLGALAALSCLLVFPICCGAWATAKELLSLSWTGTETGEITTLYLRQVSPRPKPQELSTSETTSNFIPVDYTPYKPPTRTPDKANIEEVNKKIDFSKVDNEDSSASTDSSDHESGDPFEEFAVSNTLSLANPPITGTENVIEENTNIGTTTNRIFVQPPITPLKKPEGNTQPSQGNHRKDRATIPSTRLVEATETKPETIIKPRPTIQPGTPIKAKSQTVELDDIGAMTKRMELNTQFMEVESNYKNSATSKKTVIEQLAKIHEKIDSNQFGFKIGLVEEVIGIFTNPSDTATTNGITSRLTEIAHQL